MFKKTRIAPTPSGYLHLGNIYSFLITQELAKENQTKVLLRIDDADRERTQLTYVKDILDTLPFMEISWDEGPRNVAEYQQQYSQAHRKNVYDRLLGQLAESGAIFACTCSRADVLSAGYENGYPGTCKQKNLPLDTKDCCWRIDTRKAGTFNIKVLHGSVCATFPKEMTDFVVKKKDGFAGYQLSSVGDDNYFGVDLIVRGNDLWPSTIAQYFLASVLHLDSFQGVTFHHHKLLTDHSGKKFSKSEGATSIHYLRQRGYNRDDIYRLLENTAGNTNTLNIE